MTASLMMVTEVALGFFAPLFGIHETLMVVVDENSKELVGVELLLLARLVSEVRVG